MGIPWVYKEVFYGFKQKLQCNFFHEHHVGHLLSPALGESGSVVRATVRGPATWSKGRENPCGQRKSMLSLGEENHEASWFPGKLSTFMADSSYLCWSTGGISKVETSSRPHFPGLKSTFCHSWGGGWSQIPSIQRGLAGNPPNWVRSFSQRTIDVHCHGTASRGIFRISQPLPKGS